jgi:hypothetical protein
MAILAAFLMGAFVGACALGTAVLLMLRWADVHGERAEAKAKREQVYVPSEWLA